MVVNVHTRDLQASPSEVGALIDSLASEDDRLWPGNKWPQMLFDRPLCVGAEGGHGLIRYVVDSYIPGWYIRFRFTAPAGFIGTHAFDMVEIKPGVVRLRHVINMSLQEKGIGIWWALAIRWLHDALIEDAFDRAEANFAPGPVEQRRWSVWVRFLRYIVRKKKT
ncbi:MAG: SRPBCC family protein [Bacillota bacterium]